MNLIKLAYPLLLVAIVGIVYFFADGINGEMLISDADKKYHSAAKLQEWKETGKGVRYFYDCIDGNKFIVTIAGHGKVLAGPIGECEAVK